MAVAAAGLIAAARGASLDDLSEEVVEFARAAEPREDERLRDLAIAALGRVKGEASEWRELWSEPESSAEAKVMIADLRSALA